MTVITRTNYLIVNSVPLSTPAWWCRDLEPVLLSSPSLKGADIDVPHAVGSLANPRRVAATTKQIQMVVLGALDKDGTPYANQMRGLVTNVEYLTANLGIGLSTGAGTVTATWKRPGLSDKTAAVHVIDFQTSPLTDRPQVNAVLEISLPLGVFA